jgi:hypothetical protein
MYGAPDEREGAADVGDALQTVITGQLERVWEQRVRRQRSPAFLILRRSMAAPHRPAHTAGEGRACGRDETSTGFVQDSVETIGRS